MISLICTFQFGESNIPVGHGKRAD